MNDFAKHCDAHSRMDRECRECRKAYQRWHYRENKDDYKTKHAEWYQANKHLHKENTTVAARKRRFGITEEQFKNRLHNQNWQCEICSCDINQSACVDHDHATGKVRGLLCRTCNAGLGLFKDLKQNLINAANYLEKHSFADD